MNGIRQIIAIGGGGFGRNPNQRIIEKYILEQSDSDRPNILFIPTASAEDKEYTVNFYTCFSKLRCAPAHLNLFERTPRLEGVINWADIIYVGGGNTKSMLAVWKEWKLERLLIRAYKRGTVLAGVSAGAICWFQQGITDSWASNLNVMDCLGVLEGMCCPHYDSEPERKPAVHGFLKTGKSLPGFAIEDGAAIHFRDETVYQGLSFMENATAYSVSGTDGEVSEKKIRMETLL